MLKQYKYFAVKVDRMVVIRRTLVGLKVVTSKLYKPGSDFTLTQTTYTGGKVVGAIKLSEYQIRCASRNSLLTKQVCKIDREFAKALTPFLIAGE